MGQPFLISALVEHKPGVLFRVANIFRRRGINIESIAIGPSEQPDLARITITIVGDELDAAKVVKYLDNLIDVIKAEILEWRNSVVRELALVKLSVSDSTIRSQIMNYASAFRGRIVDVAHDSLTIEVAGDSEKIDAFVELCRTLGLKEVSRTGVTALQRGLKGTGFGGSRLQATIQI